MNSILVAVTKEQIIKFHLNWSFYGATTYCTFFSQLCPWKSRDFKIQQHDSNKNVTQKWIYVLSVFIAIIPAHFLCQM